MIFCRSFFCLTDYYSNYYSDYYNYYSDYYNYYSDYYPDYYNYFDYYNYYSDYYSDYYNYYSDYYSDYYNYYSDYYSDYYNYYSDYYHNYYFDCSYYHLLCLILIISMNLHPEAAALANSSPGTLSPKHLGPLIHILRDIDGQQSPDDDLAERILVTLANSAAFTGSQVPELGRRFRWCSRHGGTWRLYILWSCCNDFVRKSQNVRPLTTSALGCKSTNAV
uniref:uncharacterized protein isoform X3 n=1 Tax=Myxine glutinosa TaxID=7769 RepID=UPI00358E6C86